MASVGITLTETYTEIATGSATIQKVSSHMGTVLLCFSATTPANDTGSFTFSNTEPQFFPTEDKIYARTPNGSDVRLIVGL